MGRSLNFTDGNRPAVHSCHLQSFQSCGSTSIDVRPWYSHWKPLFHFHGTRKWQWQAVFCLPEMWVHALRTRRRQWVGRSSVAHTSVPVAIAPRKILQTSFENVDLLPQIAYDFTLVTQYFSLHISHGLIIASMSVSPINMWTFESRTDQWVQYPAVSSAGWLLCRFEHSDPDVGIWWTDLLTVKLLDSITTFKPWEAELPLESVTASTAPSFLHPLPLSFCKEGKESCSSQAWSSVSLDSPLLWTHLVGNMAPHLWY